MKCRAQSGMSLVEIVVAMALVSAVLIPIAGISLMGTSRSLQAAGAGYRQGILVQEVNRLTAVPFVALPGFAGCTTVGSGTFPHTRCVTVTNVSATQRRITVAVTPAQPGVPPDSAVFDRTKPPTGNPLNTP